ncbi:hypothetical protein CSKR_110086 [Clonorchis sinensis]|uniref:C2H2-type domain-containing protein n=1 Tax=Clonorchis sinensis TaxID=79923 RepID=A0A8T1MM30_CLOSI|nr:hypothetical protein CSKR_110086 [Clonorchis sinensis]
MGYKCFSKQAQILGSSSPLSTTMTELKIKETIPVCQLTQFLHGPPSSGLNFIHVVLEIICGNHDLNIAVECLRKYTMTMRKECSLRNTPVHPFVFRQRKEKVDWRRLASIDVNRVINEMDVGTLQDVLSSVAFCDITCEVDMRCVDSNLIKLFQLAQLLVEYLLHSQNYLISSVNSLKEENASLQKDLSSAKQDLAEKMNKLTAVRRECHRRRLLLLAQQQLMDSGPQSYHRCLYCPKAFLNASFLAAHVQRRHLETENPRQPQTLIAECGSKKTPLMAETVHIQTNNVQTDAMEKDVRDLLAYLRSNSSKPEAGVPPQNKQSGGKLRHVATHTGTLDEFACKEVYVTEENEKSDWKRTIAEENRQELEALKRIFENELRDLRKQYEVTQADLAELKAKPAMSNVGEIVDDTAKVSSRQHPTKGTPTSSEAIVKESVSPDGTFHQPFSTIHSKGPRNESEPTITNENEALASPTLEVGFLRPCDHRHIMSRHSKPTVPIFRLKKMIPIQENVIYRPHDVTPEDSDDKAESDITVPVLAHSPCDCTRRSLRVRSTNPSFVDGREDELDDCLFNLRDVRKCRKNKRLICGCKDQFTCRKTKHVRKRIRSTAIQVGLGKDSKLSVSGGRKVIHTNGMQDNSIFLKVRRKYSRSGSSTATHRSPSPKAKQLTDRIHGFSREIVIVRTDDEELPTEQTFRGKSETTASIQLMPLVCSENASCVAPHWKNDSVSSVRRVGVNATDLPSHLLPQEHSIVCDRPHIQPSVGRMFEGSESKISKSSRQSSEHLSASVDGTPLYHPSKMQPVETDRPAFDNTRKTFKKAVCYEDSGSENKGEPVFDSTVQLPTTTCASIPLPKQFLDSSLLRHGRLLEQLRADPQTIQGLRHEVERLLSEHLVERNINIDQTRLSTSKFNEHLGALNRDREHLCRKHLNFMKTREALAQHVDRLARAALSGRSVDRMASSIFYAGSQQSVKGRSLSRSRLPPSGVYSPGCVHQSSVPHSTQQHTNIHSPVGQSMPTLTGPEQEIQHFGISPFRSTGSIRLTQHNPPTRRYDPQIDTRSGVGSQSVDHQSLSSRGSSDRLGRSSKQSRFAATAQPSAPQHHQPGCSTRTFSPHTSPVTYFSHDRRVVTFGPGHSDGKNFTDTSNDDWNSSKEDLQNPVGRVKRKTKGIGDNSEGIEHDNDIQVISQSRPAQSNTNAQFMVPSAGGSTPGKMQNTRTDEEDMFSVSSINGNGNDENSLEFNRETPHKQDADLFGVRCSIDPSVIEAHAQSAALGPRPTTRFGSTDRQVPLATSPEFGLHRPV